MPRFEAIRPLEGMSDPLQVRIDLRQMFERWLSKPQHSLSICGRTGAVDGTNILDLCQHYRLEYLGGVENLSQSWDESKQRIAEEGPTFNDLERSGWIFFDGNRWSMQSTPLGVSIHITFPTPSTGIFLTSLGKMRLVAKTDMPSLTAKNVADKIVSENWLERYIPTKDTDWLIGRLWERLCPDTSFHSDNNDEHSTQPVSSDESRISAAPDAVDRAFLEWSAWCEALGCAAKWDLNWSSAQKQYCREAAERVLERQKMWGTWDNDISSYADVLKNTFAIPHDQLRYCQPHRVEPPRTLVSRLDWLEWPEVEHFIMARVSRSSVFFAFGLLCSELENTDIGPNIMSNAAKVLSFAADHPMALKLFLLRVHSVPALLVDMLMNSRMACLAAKLAIVWRTKGRLNSDRYVIRDAQTKAFAIQDSLSFLAYHLNNGMIDTEEYASLITWCYTASSGSGRTVVDSTKFIGKQLIGNVAKGDEKLQSAVMQYLISQMSYQNNVSRACFAGVLTGLSYLLSAQVRDTHSIVALYSEFAQQMKLDWTDVPDLSAELAARLVATAFKQTEFDRDALLIPFDSTKLLREVSDDKQPILNSSIARTMREHVRFLARAVTGWPDDSIPTELCNALQTLISRNTIDHAEKGRVGALTDRYSPSLFWGHEESSPAQDLATAWSRLDDSHKETMLQLLAQSDDPVLLSELSLHLPATAKSLIQIRLRQLKPGEASEPWTWPELQRRIESLLNVEEYQLAREHLTKAGQELSRAPQEFRLSFFGLELRLLLREKNWKALDGSSIPSALNEFGMRHAQEQLDFYRATSQLLRPNGNLVEARAVLERLAADNTMIPAYKENVFAVAIQQLLGPNLHPLTGIDKVTGEKLLSEVNEVVEADKSSASSSLLANRALLLLALKRPEDALESVATRRREKTSSGLEIIAVLATAEMGRRNEAMAILDAAIAEFGADDQFIAVKQDLEAGFPAASTTLPFVSVDRISLIRAALQQLVELPPDQLGDILGPPGGGVRGYLTRQVSRAVAAIQHMASMLRDRKNPEDQARLENDLNTAAREVLGASLAIVKWDVADQSLGGLTERGNPGERDAVIRISGQEISIYEALVCSGLERAYTKEHFHKLLSYGICDVYFHVTYSYAKELKPLLDYIREMLEYEAPPSLTYVNSEILGPPYTEVSGYMATYRTGYREFAVVFLVADFRK